MRRSQAVRQKIADLNLRLDRLDWQVGECFNRGDIKGAEKKRAEYLRVKNELEKIVNSDRREYWGIQCHFCGSKRTYVTGHMTYTCNNCGYGRQL